jgi:hypothetical protein
MVGIMKSESEFSVVRHSFSHFKQRLIVCQTGDETLRNSPDAYLGTRQGPGQTGGAILLPPPLIAERTGNSKSFSNRELK